MKKNRECVRLIKLYLSYHINILTCIILGLVLALWAISLLLNAGFPLEKENYIANYKIFHLNYFEQSLFFLQILDGFIVAFLIGAEVNSFSTFDPMFVANVSRIKIIIAKILSNMIILLGILIAQVLILNLIASLIYPNFVFEIHSLVLILYVLIPFVELLMIGELISILFNSYFIPILIFILHLVILIAMRIEKIHKILSIFIPQVEYVGENNYQLNGNAFLSLGLCILLGIGVCLLFQKKDIMSN